MFRTIRERLRWTGRSKVTATILGSAVALVFLAAAFAQALIPAPDGTISGCYKKNQGQLRVIDTDKVTKCRPSERSLTWSQTGPQGPAGVSGYEVVETDFLVAPGGFVRDDSLCPVGKVVWGGGAQVVREGSSNFHTVVQESAPGTIGGGTQSGWLAAVQNNDAVPHTIGIFAVCANAT